MIYKPTEFEISGDAWRKIETFQYKILRNLSKEIEDKIALSEKDEFTDRVIRYKNNPDEISVLAGDGNKRVLKVSGILNNENGNFSKKESDDENHIKVPVSKKKLKEFKEALDEGLITTEEYENAKKEFLKL